MAILLEKAITYVKQKDDITFQEYHARRLLEMTTRVVLGYLLLRDAAKSDRKKDLTTYYLEFALPEVKMKSEIITNNTSSLMTKKNCILNEKN
jgi:hypothetical protein